MIVVSEVAVVLGNRRTNWPRLYKVEREQYLKKSKNAAIGKRSDGFKVISCTLLPSEV